MNRHTIMIQGTTSDAGKTTVVAGLCRFFANQGVNVAPFKPQNMALNSAVTNDGGEIGRAQALQALASRVSPTVDMNPILIKPTSDTGAQIIVQGKALQDMDAVAFHDYKKVAMDAVLVSHRKLESQYDLIVAEGAGSPAEINLRDGDIANMGFAEKVDCPVIIVADIDRGGVFAHLVGTLELLSKSEQDRVVGFLINKFRGDISLLQPGLDWLENKTSKPVLGVLPYIPNLYLDAEDAISTQQKIENEGDTFNVVVIVLPRMSNHTDFDALRLQSDVNLQFVADANVAPSAELVVIPGSKSVMSDLTWLKESGWSDYINKHLRYGGKLIGVCGGFQMLGHAILDPEGIESTSSKMLGLNFLPVESEFKKEKHLKNRKGKLRLNGNKVDICGYEIHHGSTTVTEAGDPLIELDDGAFDGLVGKDNNVLGTYLHGLFDDPKACKELLAWAGKGRADTLDKNAVVEKNLDVLAETITQNCDVKKICQLLDISFNE